MKAPRIALFADAGSGVGAGHLFRLHPVFRALRGSGAEAGMWAPLEQHVLGRMGLDDVASCPEAIGDVIGAMGGFTPDVVVLDTYRHLPELFEAFEARGCRIAAFDDHLRIDRKAALIINSSPAARAGDYAPGLADGLLIGTDYLSIADGFVQARKAYRVRESVSRILIALGGEDTAGNLPALLRALLPLLHDPVELCVPGCEIPDGIEVPGHVGLNTDWLLQDDLARRMVEFDLAVLAGGTMLWQTACVGLPTISWPQTAGQTRHAASWEKLGSVVVIGGLADLPEAWGRLQAADSRLRLSAAGRASVDGSGAQRIASRLLALPKEAMCA